MRHRSTIKKHEMKTFAVFCGTSQRTEDV